MVQCRHIRHRKPHPAVYWRDAVGAAFCTGSPDDIGVALMELTPSDAAAPSKPASTNGGGGGGGKDHHTVRDDRPLQRSFAEDTATINRIRTRLNGTGGKLNQATALSTGPAVSHMSSFLDEGVGDHSMLFGGGGGGALTRQAVGFSSSSSMAGMHSATGFPRGIENDLSLFGRDFSNLQPQPRATAEHGIPPRGAATSISSSAALPSSPAASVSFAAAGARTSGGVPEAVLTGLLLPAASLMSAHSTSPAAPGAAHGSAHALGSGYRAYDLDDNELSRESRLFFQGANASATAASTSSSSSALMDSLSGSDTMLSSLRGRMSERYGDLISSTMNMLDASSKVLTRERQLHASYSSVASSSSALAGGAEPSLFFQTRSGSSSSNSSGQILAGGLGAGMCRLNSLEQPPQQQQQQQQRPPMSTNKRVRYSTIVKNGTASAHDSSSSGGGVNGANACDPSGAAASDDVDDGAPADDFASLLHAQREALFPGTSAAMKKGRKVSKATAAAALARARRGGPPLGLLPPFPDMEGGPSPASAAAADESTAAVPHAASLSTTLSASISEPTAAGGVTNAAAGASSRGIGGATKRGVGGVKAGKLAPVAPAAAAAVAVPGSIKLKLQRKSLASTDNEQFGAAADESALPSSRNGAAASSGGNSVSRINERTTTKVTATTTALQASPVESSSSSGGTGDDRGSKRPARSSLNIQRRGRAPTSSSSSSSSSSTTAALAAALAALAPGDSGGFDADFDYNSAKAEPAAAAADAAEPTLDTAAPPRRGKGRPWKKNGPSSAAAPAADATGVAAPDSNATGGTAVADHAPSSAAASLGESSAATAGLAAAASAAESAEAVTKSRRRAAEIAVALATVNSDLAQLLMTEQLCISAMSHLALRAPASAQAAAYMASLQKKLPDLATMKVALEGQQRTLQMEAQRHSNVPVAGAGGSSGFPTTATAASTGRFGGSHDEEDGEGSTQQQQQQLLLQRHQHDSASSSSHRKRERASSSSSSLSLLVAGTVKGNPSKKPKHAASASPAAIDAAAVTPIAISPGAFVAGAPLSLHDKSSSSSKSEKKSAKTKFQIGGGSSTNGKSSSSLTALPRKKQQQQQQQQLSNVRNFVTTPALAPLPALLRITPVSANLRSIVESLGCKAETKIINFGDTTVSRLLGSLRSRLLPILQRHSQQSSAHKADAAASATATAPSCSSLIIVARSSQFSTSTAAVAEAAPPSSSSSLGSEPGPSGGAVRLLGEVTPPRAWHWYAIPVAGNGADAPAPTRAKLKLSDSGRSDADVVKRGECSSSSSSFPSQYNSSFPSQWDIILSDVPLTALPAASYPQSSTEVELHSADSAAAGGAPDDDICTGEYVRVTVPLSSLGGAITVNNAIATTTSSAGIGNASFLSSSSTPSSRLRRGLASPARSPPQTLAASPTRLPLTLDASATKNSPSARSSAAPVEAETAAVAVITARVLRASATVGALLRAAAAATAADAGLSRTSALHTSSSGSADRGRSSPSRAAAAAAAAITAAAATAATTTPSSGSIASAAGESDAVNRTAANTASGRGALAVASASTSSFTFDGGSNTATVTAATAAASLQYDIATIQVRRLDAQGAAATTEFSAASTVFSGRRWAQSDIPASTPLSGDAAAAAHERDPAGTVSPTRAAATTASTAASAAAQSNVRVRDTTITALAADAHEMVEDTAERASEANSSPIRRRRAATTTASSASSAYSSSHAAAAAAAAGDDNSVEAATGSASDSVQPAFSPLRPTRSASSSAGAVSAFESTAHIHHDDSDPRVNRQRPSALVRAMSAALSTDVVCTSSAPVRATSAGFSTDAVGVSAAASEATSPASAISSALIHSVTQLLAGHVASSCNTPVSSIAQPTCNCGGCIGGSSSASLGSSLLRSPNTAATAAVSLGSSSSLFFLSPTTAVADAVHSAHQATCPMHLYDALQRAARACLESATAAARSFAAAVAAGRDLQPALTSPSVSDLLSALQHGEDDDDTGGGILGFMQTRGRSGTSASSSPARQLQQQRQSPPCAAAAAAAASNRGIVTASPGRWGDQTTGARKNVSSPAGAPASVATSAAAASPLRRSRSTAGTMPSVSSAGRRVALISVSPSTSPSAASAAGRSPTPTAAGDSSGLLFNSTTPGRSRGSVAAFTGSCANSDDSASRSSSATARRRRISPQLVRPPSAPSSFTAAAAAAATAGEGRISAGGGATAAAVSGRGEDLSLGESFASRHSDDVPLSRTSANGYSLGVIGSSTDGLLVPTTRTHSSSGDEDLPSRSLDGGPLFTSNRPSLDGGLLLDRRPAVTAAAGGGTAVNTDGTVAAQKSMTSAPGSVSSVAPAPLSTATTTAADVAGSASAAKRPTARRRITPCLV